MQIFGEIPEIRSNLILIIRHIVFWFLVFQKFSLKRFDSISIQIQIIFKRSIRESRIKVG